MRRHTATIVGLAGSVVTGILQGARGPLMPGAAAVLDLGPGTSYGPWVATNAEAYLALLDAQNEATATGSDGALLDLITAGHVDRYDNGTPVRIVEVRTFERVLGLPVEGVAVALAVGGEDGPTVWVQPGFVRPAKYGPRA